MVLYGSAPGNLSQSSGPVNGSADLNVIGGQFGANLTGLAPSSLYYYTVVASNTEGTTTTLVITMYRKLGREWEEGREVGEKGKRSRGREDGGGLSSLSLHCLHFYTSYHTIQQLTIPVTK